MTTDPSLLTPAQTMEDRVLVERFTANKKATVIRQLVREETTLQSLKYVPPTEAELVAGSKPIPSFPWIGGDDTDLGKRVRGYPGCLTLIGAHTGNGKTSLAAQIFLHRIDAGGKPFVILNETKRSDLLRKAAEISIGLNTTEPVMLAELKRLAKHSAIVDLDFPVGLTTTLVGLEKCLEMAVDEKATEIIIDYYSNFRGETAGQSLFNLQAIATCLDRFKNGPAIPLCIFAQLHPLKDSKQGYDNRMSARLQECKEIIRKATQAFSVDRMYPSTWSSWTIGKPERNGYHEPELDKSFYTNWEKGRFKTNTLNDDEYRILMGGAAK